MKDEFIEIRIKFGEAIREFRKKQVTLLSQSKLCDRINRKLSKTESQFLNQKSLSRIERGEKSIVLSANTVLLIAKECAISEEIYAPFLDLMNLTEEIKYGNKPLLYIKEQGQLLVNPSHSEFKMYEGEYHCYFYSTNSAEPKIINGLLTIKLDEHKSICYAEMSILKDGKIIKKYKGQFVINLHYRKAYMVLIGTEKQEICFLILNCFNATVEENQLNMALVLTTSSGSQKRPTMHRMLISRKILSDDIAKSVLPELKLNTDTITISEENLNILKNQIRKEVSDNKDIDGTTYFILNSIDHIEKNGKKEVFYTIDESEIYDSSRITNDTNIRSHIISKLREFSNATFYNKVSDTVEEICFNIINKKY